MSKKLLALDIDGTLTNTQKDITPATSTAWNKEDSRHHRA